MAPVFCCGKCGTLRQVKTFKKQFDFKVEDIPFRTKQKYECDKCVECGEEFFSAITLKAVNVEIAAARLFLQEQDRQYRINDDSPIVKINGYVEPIDYLYKSQSSKQWQRGFIHYLRMVVTADKVHIVPTSTPYEVYCNNSEKLSIAARQFVKPDDYFKLTNIT